MCSVSIPLLIFYYYYLPHFRVIVELLKLHTVVIKMGILCSNYFSNRSVLSSVCASLSLIFSSFLRVENVPCACGSAARPAEHHRGDLQSHHVGQRQRGRGAGVRLGR